jgi:hypothetical protein
MQKPGSFGFCSYIYRVYIPEESQDPRDVTIGLETDHLSFIRNRCSPRGIGVARRPMGRMVCKKTCQALPMTLLTEQGTRSFYAQQVDKSPELCPRVISPIRPTHSQRQKRIDDY